MMRSLPDSKASGKASKTITFRINSAIHEKLKVQAKKEKSTVNALVNRLLLHAVNWNVVASKSNWVPAEREVIKSVLDSIDDETVAKIARVQGKVLPKDICLSMRGLYGMKEWVDIVKLSADVAGFDLTTIQDKGQSVFVLRHDMGKKYSLHTRSFYEQALREFGVNAAFEATENTLVFKIPQKFLME